jgi:hypothetical protein
MLGYCLWFCCFTYCFRAASRDSSGQKREELPDGTAMPLGKFQEDLRLGEGLPIAGTSSK